ncbi:MAG: TIGR00375 family protein [Clostridiales bacterium]|nr:TIGR00375 family protein [Clostridiales bacterium]
MKEYFVDLHVHIGRSSDGHIIKRATSNDLTFENIAYEARYKKGINVIGVVDAISPYVIRDMERLLDEGEMEELDDGGFIYRGDLVMIAGAEIETREPKGGNAHSLMFFPHLETIKDFSKEMEKHMTNIYTNSLVSRLRLNELAHLVKDFGGIFILAHAFTPYKGIYGSCTDRLSNVFDKEMIESIQAVELGLSADTYMACQISELDGISFLSNSDAHSLPKMGREYNIMRLKGLSFRELLLGLKEERGRGIIANYGLDPRLGKYNRSFCLSCDRIIEGEMPITECDIDSSHRVLVGVMDRLEIIADRDIDCHMDRPKYHYQVPLEFLPGVGPKTIEKLINRFGTEMDILHNADEEEIAEVVGEKIAGFIVSARQGKLSLEHGGGGIYGRVKD